MRKKIAIKRIISLLCSLLCILSLAAPVSVRAAQDGYHLVFVCPNYTHEEYWGKVLAGIQEADEELHTVTEVVGGTSYDQYKIDVLTAMQEVVSRPEMPDGILAYCGIEDTLQIDAQGRATGDEGFDPKTGRSMADLILAARQRGVPVIAVDSEATEQGRQYRNAYVGTNLSNVGRNLGYYFEKTLMPGARVGVIVTSADGGNDAVVISALNEYITERGMKMEPIVSTGGDGAAARREFVQLLAQYPDLDGLYVGGTTNVDTVCSALLEGVNNRRGDLVVTVMGETASSVECIRKGKIDAAFIQQTRRMGYLGVYNMYYSLKNGALPKETFDTGTRLVTAANVDDPDNDTGLKTVRVGYYRDATAQLQAGDETRRSGYGYEYLRQITTEADWVYTYEYCGSKYEALNLLREGRVDIVGGVSGREPEYDQQTMFLSTMDMGLPDNKLYFAVNADRVDLLNALNAAMVAINESLPTYTVTLYQKYFSESVNQSLTTGEREWLQERGELTLGYIRDNLPISGADEADEPVGLIKELLSLFNDPENGFLVSNGLDQISMRAVPYPTAEDLEQALEEGEVDILFPIYADQWISEDKGLKMTDAIFSDRLTIIFRSTETKDVMEMLLNVASSPRAIGQRNYLQTLYPNIASEVKYYSSIDDALDALRAGKADCVIGASSVVQRHWNSLEDREGLTAGILDSSASYSMAVRQEDTALVSILNRFIRQISTAETTSALARYSVLDPEPVTLASFIRNNTLAAFGILMAVMAIIVAAVTLYALRERKFNAELGKAQVALEKALQTAEEANRSKTNFLSSMSHDIRTPMNAIIGMTTIAKKNLGNTEKVQDCLGKIELSGNHLLTLINDVLDISKIESGKLTMHPVNFSLRAMMTSMINIVRPMVMEKRQDFNVHIGGIRHETLYGDTVRVTQIFINILTNAVKYTPEGGQITVSLYEQVLPDGKNVHLTYVVEDTGMGMTKEYMATMYETFTRANDSRTNKIQGTGLGLAIVKQMVTMLNGTIDCESEVDKGTKFTIQFDLPIGEQQDEAELKRLSGTKLLIIDDDPLFLESTQDIIQDMELNVTTMSSGNAALAYLREHPDEKYSAILIDWKMPGMSGLETVHAIRAAGIAETPLLLMSAYEWEEIDGETDGYDIAGFISKPLFRSYLCEKLIAVLGLDQDRKTDPNRKDNDVIGLHLLVAEDNELNWEVIEDILGMYSITAAHAQDGQECLDILNASKEGDFFLVLMDVQMPVMDGKTATRTIRQSPIEHVRSIPIIAMTADAFAEDIAACLEAGMDGHLSKPVDVDKLIQEIRRFLEKKP